MVSFYPDNKSVMVEKDTTLVQAARLAGVVIESPCNSAGTCGKCKVKLDRASRENVIQAGKHHLSIEEREAGYVLACQAKVQGDVSVEIVNRQQNKTLKIVSHGKGFEVPLEPYIKKVYVESQDVTRVYGDTAVLGVEEGDTVSENFGIVVDIGTTTLVTSLVNINTGEEVDSVSSLNPQAIHAQDVLSRIKLASEEPGLHTLYTELIQEVNRMIGRLVESTGSSRERIYEVIFSGNTCMLHLAVNENPYSLGKYPYTPVVTGGSHVQAKEHQLAISEFGVIYLPPIISAYVGADITSGILASQLQDEKGITLLVDIGTNGEMVISHDGRLTAASTAAGPAFEGMNITHGMRAGKGAVELFNVEEDGTLTIKTIGETEAVGICGSGLLDIVGELAAYGIINSSGKFAGAEDENILQSLRERLVKKEGKTVFQITDTVYLSQKDVRQVQLAKGAVRAGIEFLLDSKGVKASEVDRVLIAGSFGYHLREKSLLHIGLLPKEFEGKEEFVGNTSKTGGQAFLLNKSCRQQMESQVKEIEVLELANYKDFDKVFVQCLGF